jgi:hypothetical protein
MPPLPDYDTVAQRVHVSWDNQTGSAFREALDQLLLLAESGNDQAVEYLALITALPGPLRDPAAAYKWYYIAAALQRHPVAFRDENDSPPLYCGPPGDFRNESMTNGIVEELGFERVAELDREADAWLRDRGLI